MARKLERPRVRKTLNGRHPYVATLKGYATYGWGNTPDEAKAKLLEMIAALGERRAVGRYV